MDVATLGVLLPAVTEAVTATAAELVAAVAACMLCGTSKLIVSVGGRE